MAPPVIILNSGYAAVVGRESAAHGYIDPTCAAFLYFTLYVFRLSTVFRAGSLFFHELRPRGEYGDDDERDDYGREHVLRVIDQRVDPDPRHGQRHAVKIEVAHVFAPDENAAENEADVPREAADERAEDGPSREEAREADEHVCEEIATSTRADNNLSIV